MSEIEFQPWPKIARLNRDITVTEKIDGTNAAILILEDGTVAAQSRKRLITPEDDNFGFARWVADSAGILTDTLGVGRHFGEWWGAGIQRKYGLDHKRFSLFNTSKWSDDAVRPACCHVVPVLYTGIFRTDHVFDALMQLSAMGSSAAPEFRNPEGVIVYHHAANLYFKKTLHKDEEWKGKAA